MDILIHLYQIESESARLIVQLKFENYLFIITDGYPIVGKQQVKLQDVKDQFPDLHIVLLEASPREKDMEWDRVMTIWEDWFDQIEIEQYTMIKRGAISKEMEQIERIINGS